MPLVVDGVAKNDRCRALGDKPSRIMMPALVQAATFSIDATRAVITKLPVTLRCTNWNSSAVPQISAPDPFTVNVPFAYDALPAAATSPMSWLTQPAGNPPGVGP